MNDNTVTGKSTKYVFTVNTNQELPTTSNFYVVLPSEIVMTDQVGCVSTLNSNSVTCEIEKEKNRVKVVLAK